MKNADMKPPYLAAIQAIDGQTPGEKYKTINKIVAEAAKRKQKGEQFVQIFSSLNVPQAFEPRIRIEAANVLKNCDEVIAALKSEDITISHQALKAKWFFEGTNKNIFNVDYFEENIFPHISIKTRFKVIKNMAKHLKDTSVAEQFFEAISKSYGIDEAMPLLLVCNETFIIPAIIERKIPLNLKTLSQLYRKYPEAAIEYLKMSKDGDSKSANVHKLHINDYKKFLVKLTRKDVDKFIEIFEKYGVSEHLRVNHTRSFLKGATQKLLDNPKLWLCYLSLKEVTKRLAKEQFKAMFSKLFPDEKSKFYIDYVLSYLRYYKESEKLSMVSDAFEEAYGQNILNCAGSITPTLMIMLPTEERVKQARNKLKDNDEWPAGYHYNTSWRCYLPTSESIPAIKDQIYKTADAEDRSSLLRNLAFTCTVNDDRDALRDVLEYFMARHGNEEESIRYRFLEFVISLFDLETLGAEHWAIMTDLIKKSHVRNEFESNKTVIENLVVELIHYNCSNSLPIDREIDWFIELEGDSFHPNWNILQKYPAIEEKCLRMFVKRIPEKYPEDHEYWKKHESKVVPSLIDALYSFLLRNEKRNSDIGRASIKDYPWLLEKCRSLVCDDCRKYDGKTKERVINFLKAFEKDLYDLWVKEIIQVRDPYDLKGILKILKTEPQRILHDWKEYLRSAQQSISKCEAKLFITRSRWYNEIPMKFLKQCFEDLLKPVNFKKKSAIFITLALLLDGQSFFQVIEPYLRTGSEVDIISEKTKGNYAIACTIFKCMNKANPPVPLEIMSRFCEADFIKLAFCSLTSIIRRVPVSKAMSFTKLLVDKNASVTKLAIQLTCMFAPSEEIHSYLMDLWDTEKHSSIRKIIFWKTYNYFIENPDTQTWRMMEKCVRGLTIDVEDKVLNRLLELRFVSDEYIANYVQLLFSTISALEQNGYDTDKSSRNKCTLLSNINSSVISLLPEEYCKELLTKFLFIFDDESCSVDYGKAFAIKSYILPAGDELASRLNVFGEHLEKCVKNYWDVPHPKYRERYPMNNKVHSFIHSITDNAVRQKCNVLIFEMLLDIFVSVIPPVQDPVSYLRLIFSIEIQKAHSSKDFGVRIGRKVDDLVETLSPECVTIIAGTIENFTGTNLFKDVKYLEMTINVIEGLVDVGTVYALMVAAKLLSNRETRFGERYKNIVRTLYERSEPGICCFANIHRNNVSFY